MKYQLSVCLLTGDKEKETKDKTVVFSPYSSSRDSKVSTSFLYQIPTCSRGSA